MPQAGDKLHGCLCRGLKCLCCLCSLWIVCSDLFCGQDVAKPMALFAFVLCMCCMALWSVRKRSFRSKSLRRMSLCMCIGLVAPCVYGMALSLWHLRWVCMLAVLVAYNMSPGTVLKDQRRNSFEAEKAYRPVATGSAVASKLKPWNISGVKGRQKKKLVRLMFCPMCGEGNCKNSMKEALRHGCNVLCEVVLLSFVCGRMCGNIIAQCALWHFRCSGFSAAVTESTVV